MKVTDPRKIPDDVPEDAGFTWGDEGQLRAQT